MWPLGILVSSVGLFVDGTTDIPDEERTALVGLLGELIADRTGVPVSIEPLWDGAGGAHDVVRIRIVGGLSVDRVVARRSGRRSLDTSVDVPREEAGRRLVLTALAETLFPEPIERSDKPDTPPPPPPKIVETPLPVAPIVAGGVTLAAFAVGIGLGLSSRVARSDSQDPTLTLAEFDGLADRTQAHAIGADVAFAVALSAAVVGVAMWLVD